MDEIALNPCLNFGKLAFKLMQAAGLEKVPIEVLDQIYQSVQRDVLDVTHPPGMADLSLRTTAGTLLCTVEAGVVTPVQFVLR